jgi:hypothetical protein
MCSDGPILRRRRTATYCWHLGVFLSDLTNAKANPSLKALAAIARARFFSTALPVLLEITDFDDATTAALMDVQTTQSLLNGLVRVNAVLTPFQALTVRRLDEDNRRKLRR